MNIDFLIVGAAKSGTTTLFDYLIQHPSIFMPQNKEPWFFTFDNISREEIISKKQVIVNDVEQYTQLFYSANKDQIKGEASTVYLYKPCDTIKNIKKYCDRFSFLKIIIILRNPIERAYSHYLNLVRSGVVLDNCNFHNYVKKCCLGGEPELWDIVRYGFYYKQCKEYLNAFNSVKIILFEDFITDQNIILKDVYSFLDVEVFNALEPIRSNSSGLPSNWLVNKIIFQNNIVKRAAKKIFPKKFRTNAIRKINELNLVKHSFPEEDRHMMRDIYIADINNLSKLIDRDLSHWLK